MYKKSFLFIWNCIRDKYNILEQNSIQTSDYGIKEEREMLYSKQSPMLEYLSLSCIFLTFTS